MPEADEVPARPRRSFIVASLTERLPIKFSAILFALVVWAVVRGEEPTELVMWARFVPVVDASLQLTGSVPDSVEVVVAGRRREVLKLRTNPPVVRRRFDEDTPRRFRTTLLVTDVEFPLGVEATARAVRPNTLTLNFRPNPVAPKEVP